MKLFNARRASNEKGIAAVEAALVFPLLLLFLFGIVNYGFALYNKSVLVNASREAAREGVLLTVANSNPDFSTIQRTWTEYAAARVVDFGLATEPTITLTKQTTADGDVVLARSEFDYQGVAMGLIGMGDTMSINAQTRMRFE